MQGLKEAKRRIEVLLRSKFGAVWIRTSEELRARRTIEAIAKGLNCKVVFWSCIGGFGLYIDGQMLWQVDVAEGLVDDELLSKAKYPLTTAVDGVVHDEAIAAFRALKRDEERALYCFFDCADFLDSEVAGNEPKTYRALREMIASISDFAPDQAKAIVFVDRKPAPKLPNVIQLDFPLPNRDECERIVSTVIDALPNADKVKLDLVDNGNKDKIIASVQGLEAEAINNAIKTSVVDIGKVDPQLLLDSKKALIAGSGFVEWIEKDERGMDNIGGVEVFKDFIVRLRPRFNARALEYGLKKPLALFVGGIPGTGKSATFKSMLACFDMPGLLVRPTESKYVGESQANTLEVFRIARAIAPCCLLWDEVEKTFGGAGTDSSGVTLKLLGILLTEMQKDFDNDSGVFHYFTANNPLNVAGELFRRCESLFWIDLPTTVELKSICDVMKARYSVTKDVNSDKVAASARKLQLTGAEVEKAFLGGMTISFEDNERPTETKDILKALEQIVPVIKSYEAQIEALRQWGKQVAQASLPETKAKSTKVDETLQTLM